MVRNPDLVERQLTSAIAWTLRRPFAQFAACDLQGFDTTALNGVRPPDPSTIGVWQLTQHHARIKALLRQLPHLPQVLIEFGYEEDSDWVKQYVD